MTENIQSAPWDTSDGQTTCGPVPAVTRAESALAALEAAKELFEAGNRLLAAEQERSQKQHPAAQLTKQEIVTEVRELQSHFKKLEGEYKLAPAAQRTHLREEMQPLVDRERELRAEYIGRAAQEINQDRIPTDIGYGR